MSVLLPFRWFYNIVGDSRCPISDTWWQTETGGFMVKIFTVYTSCEI
jgi:acyl-coenzyme A synthetase/AMP-(fatty) acid ligase